MDGSNNWKSKNVLNLGLQPRSFEEIDSDRMHYISRLQRQDGYTLDLFRRFAHVEDRISNGSISGRKKAKKHWNWLKQKIGDSIKKEKSLLSRIGELHIEIQCRERWCQIRGDRGFQDMTCHPIGYGEFLLPTTLHPPPTPRLISYPLVNTGTYALNVYPPTFAPIAPCFVYPQPAITSGTSCPCGCNWEYQHANHSSAPCSFQANIPGLGPATQAQATTDNLTLANGILEADGHPDVIELDGGSYEYEGMGVSVIGREGKIKRTQSLPSLCFRWTGVDEKDEEAHICVGYDFHWKATGSLR
ncbi:hypothetical protein F4810DRAFT_446682 [Camillea tinctor]|nr:hypothetical protein F4810DRAFT_446682 [Camillea tinctor]